MFSGQVAQADLYAILGVNPTASDAEIKQAFRKKAIETHPDRNPGPDATAQFQAVQQAYETLSDAGKRAAYDYTSAAVGTTVMQSDLSLLIHFVKMRDVDGIKLLITMHVLTLWGDGGNPHNWYMNDPRSVDKAMCDAIENGYDEIVTILLAMKVSADKISRHGFTYLGYAARGDRVDIMQLLVQHGASIMLAIEETKNFYGYSTDGEQAAACKNILQHLVNLAKQTFKSAGLAKMRKTYGDFIDFYTKPKSASVPLTAKVSGFFSGLFSRRHTMDKNKAHPDKNKSHGIN